MNRTAARRSPTMREYHTIRLRERCPLDLVEEVPARPESLCLAADSSASLFQEKDGTGRVLPLPDMEKRLIQASEDITIVLMILLTINAVYLSRGRNPVCFSPACAAPSDCLRSDGPR